MAREFLGSVVTGTLSLDDLIDDFLPFELHRRLYEDVWLWAGRAATRERTIGVAPEAIRQELRASVDTIRYRWHRTDDWDARALGMVVHADAARIHPFVDGNGRATRLWANLVYAAAQPDDGPFLQYDWTIDKRDYIDALRSYDRTRSIDALLAVVPVTAVE